MFIKLHKLRLSNYRLWSILISCAVVIGLCLYAPHYVHAAINKQINFQGKVTNTNGTNVSNGSYSFTFSIYSVSNGGSPIWTESKSLTVTDGIFHTALGDVTSLPGSLNFDSDTLYLGITFHTDTEMSPRIRLTAVPYAFNSDMLDGLDSTALLRSNTSTSYTSGTLSFSTGTTLDVNAGATLDVNGGLSIADTDVTFDGGNTSFDISGAGTRTLSIYNSTSAQVADLDLADGDLKTGGTSRLTNGGALQNIIGYTQSSGNFAISGTGTFGTGTGAVSLNGDTTIASGKLLRITGGAGDPTATNGVVWYDTTANKFKVVENGTVKILCNTTDAGCGAGGTAKWNTIQAPDGNTSLSMGTYTTSFAWTQSTTNAFTNTFNSLTSGKGLYLSSTATGMTGNMMELDLTGSNSGNTGNVLRAAVSGTSSAAVPLMVTNLGTGSSFRVNDETGDTDTTPFVIDASGNVGIGTTTANNKLSVSGAADISGKLGLGGSISGSDYLFNITSNTTDDYSRVINISHTNDFSEDSDVLYITNTPTLGTIATDRTNRSLYVTQTPSLTVGAGAINSYNVLADLNGSLGQTTLGPNSSGSNNDAYLKGVSTSLSLTPIFNNSGSTNSNARVWGGQINLSGAPSLLNVPASSNMITYGLDITDTSSSGGNANLTYTKRGIYTNLSGNLTTTGTTTKFGNQVSVSGTADTNYGVYVGADGATTNYGIYIADPPASANNWALYSASGAQSYFAGNVGIGDVSPAYALTVGNGDLFGVTSNGYVLAPAGVLGAGTLSYSFTGDTNTGIYSSGSDVFDIVAGGVRSASFATAASGVNYLQFTPAAAGAGPAVAAVGASTDVPLLFSAKGAGKIDFTSGNVSGTTTSSGFVFNGNSITTGTGMYVTSSSITQGKLVDINTGSANTLSTGVLLNLASQSTALSSGGLLSMDWSPGSSTTATGDLFSLNIGPNGNVGYIMNIKDSGGTVFGVSESQITSALPHQFTAAGDVSIAYDLVFTNPSISSIKSQSPLSIVAGEVFNSSDLSLSTYNSGNINLTAGSTGSILANNDTTIASGKLFTITGGAGSPTATNGVVWYDTTANKFKVVENGTVKILCNTTDGTCGTVAWNSLGAPGGNASINMSTNTTSFSWAQTTTNAFTNTFNSLTSGKGLYLSSTATGMTGNMMELDLTGSNSGNTGNVLRAAVSGTSSAAVPLMVTNLGTGSSFRVNDETGDTDTTPFVIDAAGKVGIGTTTTTEALNVNGNILVGAQADNTSSVSLVNGTAGTYASQSNIDGAYSSTVYNGKLYVGTKETDNAGVYRYDGGGSWTLISNAAGKIVSGDAQDIDAVTLTVFNGKLYAATRTGAAGTGAVYEYNGSTWTMITPARGTVGAETARDGVYDIHVWNNRLYIVTEEANAAGLYRFDGGTTWTKLNATVGKGLAETTADIDAGVLISYGGRLWWGAITGAATGRVYMYDGNTFILINTTAGQLASGTTGVPDVTAFGVYAGQLFVGTGNVASSTFNLANVYVYKGGVPGAAGASVFIKLTATSGRVDATNDATDVDYISAIKTYNGRLYVGSSTSAGGNAGGLYEYNGINAFTTIGTRGTFGSQNNVDQVDTLLEFNGTLYIGTEDSANNTGSIYSFTKTSSNSFGIMFDSGSGNYGELSFVGGTQSQDNANHMGTFLLSHPLASTTGAFDYAEDYPTFDESVEAGDVVSIDPTTPEYVRKGMGGMEYVGIVSENPGFRLQQTGEKANEARYVPVALVGRVPVKVSTESGQIYPGDYLTGSSVPGVAMKAVKGGAVIGQAMEGYSGEGMGKIVVFVQNTHILGGSVSDLLGASNEGIEKLTGIDEGMQILSMLKRGAASQQTSEVLADRIAATQDIIAPTIIANTLVVDTIRANRIEGLEMITGKLTVLDAAVASVAARFAPSPEATSSALVDAGQLVSGKVDGLTITGTASISGDLRVGGSSLIEGILNVIDTITTPRLIVGNWASFMGKVLFRGDVEFTGRPTFNADTAGYVLIKAGAREATVHFEKPYEQKPVVSASFVIAPTDTDQRSASDEALMTQLYQFVVKDVTEQGFTLVLNKPAKETMQLSWIAIAVRKTAEGQVLPADSTWRDRVSSLSAELSVTPSLPPSPSSFFLTTPIATGEGVVEN